MAGGTDLMVLIKEKLLAPRLLIDGENTIAGNFA